MLDRWVCLIVLQCLLYQPMLLVFEYVRLVFWPSQVFFLLFEGHLLLYYRVAGKGLDCKRRQEIRGHGRVFF